MLILYIVVGIAVALLIGLWVMAVKIQAPRSKECHFQLNMPYENVSFRSEKSTVKGWFIPSSQSGRQSLIVIVHGWTSSRERVQRYVQPLYDAGYALMLFDVRGHGESDRVPVISVKIFHEDIVAAIQYAKQRSDVDPDRVGILAHSYGGFSSMIANQEEIGVKAIVTDSAPVYFSSMMKSLLEKKKIPYVPFGTVLSQIILWRAGIFGKKQKKQYQVLEAMKHRKAPILLVHSVHDDYVPASELESVVERFDVPHLFVHTEGHRSSQMDPQFWSAVLPFFNNNLDNH